MQMMLTIEAPKLSATFTDCMPMKKVDCIDKRHQLLQNRRCISSEDL
jgi:hypothetical protein